MERSRSRMISSTKYTRGNEATGSVLKRTRAEKTSVFGLEREIVDTLKDHDNNACVPAWIGAQPGWEAWAQCCPLHTDHMM